MRLRTTLLALLVFIGIVLAGTVYAGFALYKGDIVDQERRDIEVTADAIAENLDARLQEKRTTVAFVADDPTASQHGSEGQAALLERFVAGTQFDGASIVAPNGTMVAFRAANVTSAERASLVGSDFSNRTYVRRALAGETSVGDPISAASGNHIVPISAPIREADGDLAGAFTGSFHLGRSSVFGRLAEVPGPAETITVSNGQQRLYSAGDNGSAFLAATSTVNESGWTLRLSQGPSVVDDRLWGATTAQAGALVLAILSLGLFGAVVYRTTIGHLDELIDGLTDLEAGQYDQQLDLGLTEEWDRISSQFNALAETLAQRESQLHVLNRVLRHNLRNDMSVIIANAETIIHGSAADDVEHAQTIRETAYNLVETGEHARTIYEELLAGSDVQRAPVDVAAIVERQAAQLRADFPDSSIETDLSVAAWAMDGEAIPIIVDELARNGLVHNDKPPDERQVWLRVEPHADEDLIDVCVRDNGPGLPDVEAELLTGTREETTIEHGSGLGLWVVNWLVQQLDGEIGFESNQRGTSVTVALPAAERPPGPTLEHTPTSWSADSEIPGGHHDEGAGPDLRADVGDGTGADDPEADADDETGEDAENEPN